MLALDAELNRGPLAPELCDHIGFVLAKARDSFQSSLGGIFREFGIEGRQFGILVLISKRGGAVRQTDIASALRIDRTTAMHCIDELEAAELIQRQPHPLDRRAHAVKITPAGLKILKRMTPSLEKAEQQFLSRLSQSERSTLLELLSRLVTQ